MNQTQYNKVLKARNLVVKSFDVYKVPAPYQNVILEAFDSGLSGEWDIYNMDGCTFINDYWVNKFSPSCTPHDYHSRTGRGGWLANRLMTEINKCYALPSRAVNFRLIMTTIGHYGFFGIRDFVLKKQKNYTPIMIKALIYYKKNGKLNTYKN